MHALEIVSAGVVPHHGHAEWKLMSTLGLAPALSPTLAHARASHLHVIHVDRRTGPRRDTYRLLVKEDSKLNDSQQVAYLIESHCLASWVM